MTINRGTGGAGALGTDSYQILGLLSAFKTGDVMIDTIIAMCLPLILKALFSWLSKQEKWLYYQTWYKWLYGKQDENKDVHERFITWTSKVDSGGRVVSLSANTQNQALLKAINLYLHQIVKLDVKSAFLDLSETSNNKRYLNGRRILPSGTMFSMLSGYEIINRLPPGKWYDLGKYGDPVGHVKLRIDTTTTAGKNNDGNDNDNDGDAAGRGSAARSDNSGKNSSTTTFHFKSDIKGACDAFVTAAYQWYLDELQKQEDQRLRYYYEMKRKETSWFETGRSDDGGDGANKRTTFKRYLLSDDKTFANLFFPEKQGLLSLIDHFTNKTGKYAIAGYPQKLGLLLHGPPGTGKTSLIKALAQITGRSVINVPLTQIKTNSELMSIVYDRQFRLENGLNINMEFNDCIFVMEDVDAAADVVKRRDGKTDTSGFDDKPRETVDLPAPKSVFRMFLESTTKECMEVVAELVKKSERLKEEEETQRPDVVRAITNRLTTLPGLGLVGEVEKPVVVNKLCNSAIKSSTDLQAQCTKLDKILSSHATEIKKQLTAGATVDDNLVDALLGMEVTSLQGTASLSDSVSSDDDDDQSIQSPSESDSPISSADLQLRAIMEMGFRRDSPTKDSKNDKEGMGYGGLTSSWLRPDPDKLSLAGLLNCLDGVVDSPSRIVIMTTNHPEKLDPALIRPGRIDKKLLLGYMAAPDIVLMLEHFFQETLNEDQKDRIAVAVSDKSVQLTPAQVEQLAAEHDDLDAMVETIESKAAPKLQFKL